MKSFAGHDVAGLEVKFQQVPDGGAGAEALIQLRRIFRRGAENVGQATGPGTSMKEAMVLAVYMPPQAPLPGQDLATISLRSSSVMVPSMNLAVALEGGDDVELFLVAADSWPPRGWCRRTP